MQVLLNATYKNGTLILDKRLGIEKEGRKFKVILFEQESSEVKKERLFGSKAGESSFKSIVFFLVKANLLFKAKYSLLSTKKTILAVGRLCFCTYIISRRPPKTPRTPSKIHQEVADSVCWSKIDCFIEELLVKNQVQKLSRKSINQPVRLHKTKNKSFVKKKGSQQKKVCLK